MIILSVLVSVLAVMAAMVAVLLWRNSRIANDNSRLRKMVDNLGSYSFLVDPGFEVKETNFYTINRNLQEASPRILGNVLRCRNACDSGECGRGMACKQCPVRFIISKSFDREDDFGGLEASMEMYAEDYHKFNMDVNLDGHFVKIDNKPYMVVNVADVTRVKYEHSLPRVIYATDDVAQYNKVREALLGECRVVKAESAKHLLNRVCGPVDYHYAAVMADQDFASRESTIQTIRHTMPSMPVVIVQTGMTTDAVKQKVMEAIG